MYKNNKYLRNIIELILRLIMIVRRMVPLFDIMYNNFFAKCHGNTILRLKPVSYTDYCKTADGRITIVEKNQKRIVYEPAYYNISEGREHTFISKPIYIAELNNVYAHGGTGLVIAGENVLTDVCANDVDNRVEYVFGAIKRANKDNFYIEASMDYDEIDCAVNLCGLAASNYYHLTFEILSRFEYVKQYLSNRKA